MTESLQGQQYLQHLAQFDHWNARAFLGIVVAFGFPESHLDVGCGTGAMVRTARRAGIRSIGIDILAEAGLDMEGFVRVDAGMPFDLKDRFSLITCVEVGEHIHPSKVGVFVLNIAKHAADRSMLVWTSASPGQGGENHQTLIPAYQWRSMFFEHDLKYSEEMTYRLRAVWKAVPMPMMWLADNLQVFLRP